MGARICLAGRIAVTVGRRTVDERALPGRQPRLVLALLVAEHGRVVAREELADNLWWAERPRTWETALRGLVSRLRRFLADAGLDEPDLVRAESGGYVMRLPVGCEVDIERARQELSAGEAALAAEELERAAAAAASASAVLDRPLLPGVECAWAQRTRSRLADLRLRSLEVLAEARLRRGEHRTAATAAAEAVDLDPFRESSHRLLMRAHAAAGNGAAALRAYQRCRELLVEELGVEPSPATQALHVALLQGRALAPPQRTSPSRVPLQPLRLLGARAE